MGKQNRQRRREKAKKRQHDQRSREPRRGAPVDEMFVDAIVDAAADACASGDVETYAHLFGLLEEGPPEADGIGQVDRAVLAALERRLADAWWGGWQPADVARIVRRELTAAHGRVLVDAVATQHRQYAAATIDGRWADQLVAMDASVWWNATPSYLRQRADRDGVERVTVLAHALEVLAQLRTIPVLPKLMPPPGEARAATSRAASGIDSRLLERVRALLAKAESTTFAEEAEALTAKAQELMARHAIDQAMLDASLGQGPAAEGRRIGVDDPYAGPKALLLSKVADANRCRSVWLSELGCSDVFGAMADLDAVELLFTSLLRQATSSMVVGAPRRQGGGAGTRSFRQSFLVAFAIRIGTRLHDQDGDTVASATAEHGPGLLPILARRSAAADEAVEAAHPQTDRRGPSANDPAGWAAGTAAADGASLRIRAEIDATKR